MAEAEALDATQRRQEEGEALMARPSTGTVQWSGSRWRARITLADGSRPWVDLPEGIGQRDVERARAKARELATYAREHGYTKAPTGELTSDRETVREYAARWLADRERRALRSVRDDRGRLAAHVFPTLGDTPIRAITPKECRALVAALDAKVSADAMAWRTALNVWAVFAKMLADACGSKAEALRVREDNPAAGVAPPDRGIERSKAYLYPSEFLALVSSPAVSLRWRRVYALAVYTYARAGELEALRAADVDLEHGTLRVHRQADRNTGELRPTKTKMHRAVPIERNARELVAALVRATGGDDDAPLVHMPPRESGAVMLRQHLRAAGIDRAELYADDETRTPLTFHDLRATGITWCAVRGDDPIKLQRRAGHTTLDTTQRYIREAENVRVSFGDVFPPLPRELVPGEGPTTDDPAEGGVNGGREDSKRPPNRPESSQPLETTASLTGFEPVLAT